MKLVSVAAAAAGAAVVSLRVLDRETGTHLRVVNELDDALFKDLGGLAVVIEGESVQDDLVVAFLFLGLEFHPELGSAAGHTGKINLDALALFVVLL